MQLYELPGLLFSHHVLFCCSTFFLKEDVKQIPEQNSKRSPHFQQPAYMLFYSAFGDSNQKPSSKGKQDLRCTADYQPEDKR